MSTEKVRVLCVDDEPHILDLLQRALSDPKFSVDIATNVPDAIQKTRTASYRIVITDLRMPGADGIELLRHVKATSPETEVIILTGYADTKSAIEALKLGAHDYILKPLESMDEIRFSVQRALEKQELQLSNRQLLASLQAATAALERERSKQLKVISHIGTRLGQARDEAWVMNLLHQALWESIGCDLVAFAFLNSQFSQPMIRIYAQYQWPIETLESVRQAIIDEAKANDFALDALAEVPIDLVCNESSESTEATNLSTNPPPDQLRLESLLVVPMNVHDETLAWLAVGAVQPDAFGAEEVRILNIFATLGAITLDNVRLLQQIHQMAIQDGLTGLYNHRYFYDLLDAEMARARRYGQPLALILIDIDNFKRINDTYTHLAGDRVLRTIADLLQHQARRSDAVARYGGEEFAIIAPHTTEEGAAAIAERLRVLVAEHVFPIADTVEHLTLSIGVAAYDPETIRHPAEFVSRADRAMYHAKGSGGNRVVTFSEFSKELQSDGVEMS